MSTTGLNEVNYSPWSVCATTKVMLQNAEHQTGLSKKAEQLKQTVVKRQRGWYWNQREKEMSQLPHFQNYSFSIFFSLLHVTANSGELTFLKAPVLTQITLRVVLTLCLENSFPYIPLLKFKEGCFHLIE